jgi:hypothetical protein
LKQLSGDVLRRVQVLNDCARKSQQVDRTLIEEERQRRQPAQRDDARSRLAAELYGVEAMPAASASDATDAVSAHVAAFHELQGIIDGQRQGEIGAVPIVAHDNPLSSPQNAPSHGYAGNFRSTRPPESVVRIRPAAARPL